MCYLVNGNGGYLKKLSELSWVLLLPGKRSDLGCNRRGRPPCLPRCWWYTSRAGTGACPYDYSSTPGVNTYCHQSGLTNSLCLTMAERLAIGLLAYADGSRRLTM